jgi:Homing endonuclease associated repeat
MPTAMTKEEIVKAIQQCATKLKRNPNLRDLRMMHSITKQAVYKRFGCLRKALAAAGLQVTGPGHSLPEATLLLDWAAVARKLHKSPA